MPIDDIFRYFRQYDTRSFYVVSCQGYEPSEADVGAFEGEVGFRLPDEFRQFTMSPLGGLYMEVREELWPRPKPYEVGPFWSFLYGLKVFGIAEGIPDWLDIREQYKEFKAAGFADLVPFLQVVCDADMYCFDSAGRIIRWSHEEPNERRGDSVTFSELLMREIHELETRKDRKTRMGEASQP